MFASFLFQKKKNSHRNCRKSCYPKKLFSHATAANKFPFFSLLFNFSLMPLVNLWRNGYYFNLSHTKFLARYKLLSPYTWPHCAVGHSTVECIAQIIRSVPLPAAEFAIGLKKVFVRSPRTVYELNEFRNLRLHFLATLIQKTFRRYTQEKYYLRMRRSQIIISSAWRTWRVSQLLQFFVLILKFCG